MTTPFPAFNFTVALVDTGGPRLRTLAVLATSVVAGFSQCGGLESSIQVEEYREGGRATTLKFRRHATAANLRLQRGMGLSDDLWAWYAGYLSGRGRRRDGVIILQNELHLPVKAWRFRNGFPIRWTGPALDAAANRLAFEEIEIAHDGLEMV
ncbi:phage tail protein [Actinoplanes ianthinogenes]|uniref:Phage tail protein n=1 Tax=Actinoplanes ianthinogenes TaxID=122358 RepID=A0ABM7LKR3_9ACTN|nr:phage tail protein [Actinoplanes ianthinogenes]BCJ39849.1 phage tail protein [Actinoplanes ianthinogenes]GGR08564.1 phage tail protein [Actinoplanes ianthinogenes]